MYYSLVFASIPRVLCGCVAFVAAAVVLFAQVKSPVLVFFFVMFSEQHSAGLHRRLRSRYAPANEEQHFSLGAAGLRRHRPADQRNQRWHVKFFRGHYLCRCGCLLADVCKRCCRTLVPDDLPLPSHGTRRCCCLVLYLLFATSHTFFLQDPSVQSHWRSPFNSCPCPSCQFLQHKKARFWF
jgi:hypothetical protein